MKRLVVFSQKLFRQTPHGLQTTGGFTIQMDALVLILPIMVYVYITFTVMPPETLARAREILVNFRIPHHTVISEWWNLTGRLHPLHFRRRGIAGRSWSEMA